MKYRITTFVFVLAILSSLLSRADEGMWIPALLEKYNEEDMIEKGLKITADDIYNINNSSLKDAIVLFGRGCTGELVSDKGLMLTNHHCGYPQIQYHSSVEHDYLTNGFWAMNMDEELPNPGLSVKFLIRMEDVTERVLSGVTEDMKEAEKQMKIKGEIDEIIADATEGTHYNASVKPLYYGNQYFLYVMETFEDVRLVGAPPSAIGKFGGDTDNWMWPRHTGDFSVFRVYTGPDGKPAKYSEDNKPLKPKKHLKISLKGVEKGDFTMVYGYPFSTQEYLPSHAVEMILKKDRPARVELRGKRLEIMAEAMNADPRVRIQYASKYAGVSNGWKKWQGVIRGLKRLDAIEKKKELERQFMVWAHADPDRIEKYGSLLPDFEKLYEELNPLNYWLTYFSESIWGVELIRYANRYERLTFFVENEDKLEEEIEKLKNGVEGHFKDYDANIDRKIFAEMVKMFYANIDKNDHPEILQVIEDEFEGDIQAYANYVFEESYLTSADKVYKFLDKFKYKKLVKDPAFELMKGFLDYLRKEKLGRIETLSNQVDALMRDYMAGLMAFQKDKTFYPDANATMRLTYGNVSTYYPKDGVKYNYFTTLKGIMEKDNPDVYDYDVPDKLKELYETKDYGKYGRNDTMFVCFIASNHTSGGNSGSPVLNAEGHLIGLNFDRNWEGTMSDIMYDPDMCRNISLDIRYCLFIIDKFAGAGHLIEEMEFVE